MRAAILIGLASLAAAGPAQARQPDLRVAAVTTDARQATAGASLRVREVVRNAGRGRAATTVTRYYLSVDARRSLAERRRSRSHPRTALTDVLLRGARRTPALRPAQRSAPRRPGTAVVVPVGTPAGRWTVLACADDTGRVTERREDDNCRAARGKMVVAEGTPSSRMVTAALSDVFEEEPDELLAPLMDLSHATMCAAGTRSRQLSLEGALASAERLLTRRAPAGMRAFRASHEFGDARRSAAAAAAAVTANEPGAALAGLLRAHRLRPRDASTLVNAAAMATAVGLPNEAMAMLDGAAGLEPPRRSPVAWHARMLFARAQASAGLGDWSRTRSLAALAGEADPLIAAQSANLEATAHLCTGDRAAAIGRRKRARRFEDPPPEPPIDESEGRASTMRNVPFPAFVEQAAATAAFYRQLANDLRQEVATAARRMSDLRARAESVPRHPASELRTDGLFARMRAVGARPQIAAIADRAAAHIDASHAVRTQMFGDSGSGGRIEELFHEAAQACADAGDVPACVRREMRLRCAPVLRDHHNAWINALTPGYADAKEWYRSVSLARSAIATHLHDPADYDRALLEIAEEELGKVVLVVQSIEYWTTYVEAVREDCFGDPPPPQAQEAPPAPEPDGAGPCSKLLKHVTMTADLASGHTRGGVLPWGVGVAVDCDKLSIEGSVEVIPWIKGFGAVERAHRSGETTLVVGSRAEGSAGPVKGAFESAMYVKFDRSGQVADVGIRVGPGATVSPGGLTQFGGGDVIEMGIFDQPAPGALATYGGGVRGTRAGPRAADHARSASA